MMNHDMASCHLQAPTIASLGVAPGDYYRDVPVTVAVAGQTVPRVMARYQHTACHPLGGGQWRIW
jgi:hypothetical protein